MVEDPADLGAAMQELADREVPVAGPRFEPAVRLAVRRERRRRGRWLAALACVTVLLVAAVVAAAVPGIARHLPLPVGHELQRLDTRGASLEAELSAKRLALARARSQLAARLLLVESADGRWFILHYPARRPPAPLPSGVSAWGWAQPAAAPSPTATAFAAPSLTSPSPEATSSETPSPTASPSAP